MTNKLKKITDKTFASLLKEEIVLPSNYFETFNENAITLELNGIDSIEFEIETFLNEEMKKINQLSVETLSKMEEFATITDEANSAILEQDTKKINTIGQEVLKLKKELESLIEQVYIDDLTKAYNKKWIYNTFLDEEEKVENIHKFVYLRINHIDYIAQEYNEIIANNIIKFIINTIYKNIKYNSKAYNLVRYSNDIFVFIFNEETEDINTNIAELQSLIANATLKTKSGIMIKTDFSYAIDKNTKKQPFLELLEQLSNVVEEKDLLP
jgi:GGDEF domain-containing protein